MAERKVSKEVREGTVAFTFHDGAELICDPSTLSDEMKNQLILHGISQKVGDSYSGENAENCETIASKVWETLTKGEWSTRSGGGGPRISQLAEALARVTGQEVQECVGVLAEMDDDAKKDVRAHPDVKKAMAQIKLEKAQKDAESAAAAEGDDNAPDLGAMFS